MKYDQCYLFFVLPYTVILNSFLTILYFSSLSRANLNLPSGKSASHASNLSQIHSAPYLLAQLKSVIAIPAEVTKTKQWLGRWRHSPCLDLDILNACILFEDARFLCDLD